MSSIEERRVNRMKEIYDKARKIYVKYSDDLPDTIESAFFEGIERGIEHANQEASKALEAQRDKITPIIDDYFRDPDEEFGQYNYAMTESDIKKGVELILEALKEQK